MRAMVPASGSSIPRPRSLQEEGSTMEMNTVQIKGVDSTKRVSKAELKDGAKLVDYRKDHDPRRPDCGNQL